jgi:hypothetical protein
MRVPVEQPNRFPEFAQPRAGFPVLVFNAFQERFGLKRVGPPLADGYQISNQPRFDRAIQ